MEEYHTQAYARLCEIVNLQFAAHIVDLHRELVNFVVDLSHLVLQVVLVAFKLCNGMVIVLAELTKFIWFGSIKMRRKSATVAVNQIESNQALDRFSSCLPSFMLSVFFFSPVRSEITLRRSAAFASC